MVLHFGSSVHVLLSTSSSQCFLMFQKGNKIDTNFLVYPQDGTLVEADQASPIRYQVKQIPGMYIYFWFLCVSDEECNALFCSYTHTQCKPFLPAKLFVCEAILGIVMAFGVGGLIIYCCASMNLLGTVVLLILNGFNF